MNIDDCQPGTKVRVVGLAASDDIAEVDHVDYDGNVVWIREPIPGHPGRTELVDVDPDDLEAA